jgi:nicotinamidase-related amidase
MENNTLSQKSIDFIHYLEAWQNELPTFLLDDVISRPERAAILSVDMVNGFCKTGALASPRVDALIPNVAGLFTAAWEKGVRHILLSQDTHDPDALEFEAFAPHCVRGTIESETVNEIRQLHFYDQMVIFEKNSISSNIETGLTTWIENHPEVDTYIVVGDCTDICVYQSALFLRMQANEIKAQRRVIVPENCVNTYDLPVQTAISLKILPHDGDLMHSIFLYHMALNGIEIIRGFQF